MSLSTTFGNSMWDIQIPFSEEVKYWALGISVFLFLIAICILIWQIHRYYTQLTGSRHTVNSSVLNSQSPKNETSQSSQILNNQLYFHHDELRPLSCCLSSSPDLASSTDSLLDVDREHIQGTLRFSLFYEQQQSRLVVTVLEAIGLAARMFSQSVTPFVHVRVLCLAVEAEEQQLTCVLQEWQTRPVKDSCNPIFGEKFSCTVTKEEMPRVTVRLEVKKGYASPIACFWQFPVRGHHSEPTGPHNNTFSSHVKKMLCEGVVWSNQVRDFNKYSRHSVLGEVRASLKGLNILYPLEMLADLQRAKKDIVGEALLSLKYMPTSHRLEVGVLKLRMVFCSTKVEKGLYVKTKIVVNQCMIRHQRTPEKTRWDVTVFNEVLIFTLPEAHIRECILTLSVYELCPSKRSKRLIGRLSFGKSENMEDEHWRLMMHALRQPVAKWHLLYL